MVGFHGSTTRAYSRTRGDQRALASALPGSSSHLSTVHPTKPPVPAPRRSPVPTTLPATRRRKEAFPFERCGAAFQWTLFFFFCWVLLPGRVSAHDKAAQRRWKRHKRKQVARAPAAGGRFRRQAVALSIFAFIPSWFPVVPVQSLFGCL